MFTSLLKIIVYTTFLKKEHDKGKEVELRIYKIYWDFEWDYIKEN